MDDRRVWAGRAVVPAHMMAFSRPGITCKPSLSTGKGAPRGRNVGRGRLLYSATPGLFRVGEWARCYHLLPQTERKPFTATYGAKNRRWQPVVLDPNVVTNGNTNASQRCLCVRDRVRKPQ